MGKPKCVFCSVKLENKSFLFGPVGKEREIILHDIDENRRTSMKCYVCPKCGWIANFSLWQDQEDEISEASRSSLLLLKDS